MRCPSGEGVIRPSSYSRSGLLWAAIILWLLVGVPGWADPSLVVGIFQEGGQTLICVDVPGRPPAVLPAEARVPLPGPDAADGAAVVLPNVPAFTWCYGCSATSAAMMAGYYDNLPTGQYANMYTGPANGGVCPLNNETVWGHTTYPSVTCGECPISATHQGIDGRLTKGSVDDYWVDYGSTAADPYIGNWDEHSPLESTGDFMGTNQSKYACSDGSTKFFYSLNGARLYDYSGCEPTYRDGCHGMRLFVESRGYTVPAYGNYNQLIPGGAAVLGQAPNATGFTFEDYKAEIDAGRPVMIQIAGHSMVGRGYDETGGAQTLYIHNTWDNTYHTMTWGGTYSGMQHYAVAVLQLPVDPESRQPDLLIHDGSGYLGDDVYNTTGASQTHAETVDRDTTATYLVKLQNDGNVPDTITVTGPAGDADWTVQYLDAMEQDITADVTGAGYSSGVLAAGVEASLQIKVTPQSGAGTNSTRDVLLTATSTGDGAKSDAVLAQTTCAPAYQPDGLIYDGSAYLGDDVYNTTGTSQTYAQTVSRDGTATYLVKLQNDGSMPDSITVAGPAGDADWTVQYLDATEQDITAEVTGAGYSSGVLAAGAEASLQIKVTPQSGAGGNSTRDVLLTATSTGDGSRSDAVLSQTTCAPAYQPDGLIHDGSAYLGDEVYNTTGASQTHAETVDRDTTATYLVKLQNDGNMPDTITVIGPAGDADWTVQYLDATEQDITADVTGAGYSGGVLAAGAEVSLQIKVTPQSGAGGNSTRDVLLTATSTGDGSKSDAVLSQTTCAPAYQPDGLIYDGSAYLGDGLYNTSGAGQTHALSVLLCSPAVYHIRFYNDGEVADSFRISGPSGSSAWQVRYYDYATGTDITTAVTGSGWVTPAVVPNLYRRMLVEVTPLVSAAPDTTNASLVTATSQSDETKQDAVLAQTTCSTTYRPDGLIYTGTAYLGDGVYNTSGAGQTHSSSALSGSPAVYHIRFYNDGNVADSFRITGPSGSSAWQVRYYDYATGTDITAAVTGSGWDTPAVSPRLYRRIWVEVTPLTAARSNSCFAALIAATSLGDGTVKDTVKASTTCLPTHRPDGLIYNGSVYLGDDVYNTSGAGQTHSISVATGRSAVYHIRFYNDGNLTESYRITGPSGSSAWQVKYYDYATGTDITGAVTGAGWVSPTLSPRLYRRLVAEVTPLPAARGNAVFAALITAASESDATGRDVVKAVTTCIPTYQPDAMIHNGTVYVGDNIYNSTGVAQYRAQTVAPNVTATFHIRLYNDGNVSQRLAVTGPAGDAKWDVQFLDHATGTDITSEVTGAGWQTPLLSPGVYRQVRVLVTPTASALPGETLDVVVRASSVLEATNVDAVLARTTRY